jgi:transcriptional regulator with XRE-family HTH domain
MRLSRKEPRGGRDSPSRVDFMSVVGDRLRQERLLAGLSGEELGRRLAVGGEMIDRYESGEKQLSPERLVGALRVLGVPISVFFYPLQSAPSPSAVRPAHQPVRIAALRPPKLLSGRSLAEFRPLLNLWDANRGVMDREFLTDLAAGRLARQIILLRQPARSTRLVVEHIATPLLRPCQAISLVGRALEEMPDRDFGRWITEGYVETLLSEAPRLESVLADIRPPGRETVRSRYDRLLLPWRSRGERFVLSMRLVRWRHIVSENGLLPKVMHDDTRAAT